MRTAILSILLLGLTACSSDGATDGDDSSAGGGGTASGGTGAGSGTGGAASTGGTGTGATGTGATGTGGTAGSGTGGLAQTPGGMAGSPPQTWEEHWFEHVETLDLVEFNDWVVIYADSKVDRSVMGWILPYITDVWQYTVTHYGQFTDGTRDGRVYMIFHEDDYSGGHPGYYYESDHDNRNVSDTGPGPWTEGNYDMVTHEISHIVESCTNESYGSPAFNLWHDSKWAEFYLYDVYMALGLTEEAERVFDDFSSKSDAGYDGVDAYWFRDWFYPLWRDHGGVDVMANFFRVLSEHFPKNGDNRYSRDLNFGEYVHFMSGAVGTNLKSMATDAFGWPQALEDEFVAAQAEFPGVTY